MVVCGGGIGGLFFAAALRSTSPRAYRVTVLEREGVLVRSHPSVGGGIGLWPPSLHALFMHGVLDCPVFPRQTATEAPLATLRDVGEWMPPPCYTDHRGRILAAPTDFFTQRFPVFCLRRDQLLRALAQRCFELGVDIQLSATVTEVNPRGGGDDAFPPTTRPAGPNGLVSQLPGPRLVEVQTSDGRLFLADIVVGADGIHSRVRKRSSGAPPSSVHTSTPSAAVEQAVVTPVHCGYTYFRACVSMPDAEWHKMSFESWGPAQHRSRPGSTTTKGGARFGYVPLKYPEVFWFASLPNQVGLPWLAPRDGSHVIDEGVKAELMEAFRAWKAPVHPGVVSEPAAPRSMPSTCSAFPAATWSTDDVPHRSHSSSSPTLHPTPLPHDAVAASGRSIVDLLAVTPAATILRTDIHKVPAVTHYPWSHCGGRIVLLGDACHATAPNLAQGAGLAIEDGCDLAFLLHRCAAAAPTALTSPRQRMMEKGRDEGATRRDEEEEGGDRSASSWAEEAAFDAHLSTAVGVYERERKGRAAVVQGMADAVATAGHLVGPAAVLRNGVMFVTRHLMPSWQSRVFEAFVSFSLGGTARRLHWVPSFPGGVPHEAAGGEENNRRSARSGGDDLPYGSPSSMAPDGEGRDWRRATRSASSSYLLLSPMAMVLGLRAALLSTAPCPPRSGEDVSSSSSSAAALGIISGATTATAAAVDPAILQFRSDPERQERGGSGVVTVESGSMLAQGLRKVFGLPNAMTRKPFQAAVALLGGTNGKHATMSDRSPLSRQVWARFFGHEFFYSTTQRTGRWLRSPTGLVLLEGVGGPLDGVLSFGYSVTCAGGTTTEDDEDGAGAARGRGGPMALVYQSRGLWLFGRVRLPLPPFLCPQSRWVEQGIYSAIDAPSRAIDAPSSPSMPHEPRGNDIAGGMTPPSRLVGWTFDGRITLPLRHELMHYHGTFFFAPAPRSFLVGPQSQGQLDAPHRHGRHVMIFGGTGLLGRSIVRELLSQNALAAAAANKASDSATSAGGNQTVLWRITIVSRGEDSASGEADSFLTGGGHDDMTVLGGSHRTDGVVQILHWNPAAEAAAAVATNVCRETGAPSVGAPSAASSSPASWTRAVEHRHTVIINLAGSNPGLQRWSEVAMKRIQDSRITAIHAIETGLLQLQAQSGVTPRAILQASATGIYGADGHEHGQPWAVPAPSPHESLHFSKPLRATQEVGGSDTEGSDGEHALPESRGTRFRRECCEAIEEAAMAMSRRLGSCPVIGLRIGLLLSAEEGSVLPHFRLAAALGATRFGWAQPTGSPQNLPWVHVADAAAMIRVVAERPHLFLFTPRHRGDTGGRLTGKVGGEVGGVGVRSALPAVAVVAPQPATSQQLLALLRWRRSPAGCCSVFNPVGVPVPAWLLRWWLGPSACVVLDSQTLSTTTHNHDGGGEGSATARQPAALLRRAVRYPTLQDALASWECVNAVPQK